MASVGYATLDIIPSMRGIESKIGSGLTGPMTSAGTKAGKTLGTSTSRSFGGAIKGIGTLAAGMAGYFVGTKLTQFFGDAISEAREAQKVTAQTEAVIRSTGGAARVTARQIADLSAAISRKSGIDDEAIQTGANLLLTFKNIRNGIERDDKVFDEATQAIVDMGAALGGEPRDAAIQLGKALNDPVKGVSALTRVGVTFTDGQKNLIESLVDSGRTMTAQKIILQELRSEFGGSAAAQATAADKLKVAWGNFEEEIGSALLPVLDDLANWLLRVGPPAAEEFVSWFRGDGVDKLREFGEKAVQAAEDLRPLGESLLQAGRDALPTMVSALKAAVPLVKGLADAFNSLPPDAQRMLILAGGFGALNRKLSPLGGIASSAVGPLGGLRRTLGPGFIAGATLIGIDLLTDALGAVDHEAINYKKTVKDLIDGHRTLGNFNLDDILQFPNSFRSDLAGLDETLAGLSPRQGRLAFAQIKEAADDAGLSVKELTELFPRYYEAVAARRSAKLTIIDVAAIRDGMTGLLRYRDQLKNLPKKVLTQVATPGALNSRKEVIELGKRFDNLDRRQIRTIMKALDFATPQIRKVLRQLGLLDKHEAAPKVTVKAKEANQQIELTGHSMQKLDKTKVEPKLDANNKPGITATQQLMRLLGDVDKKHPKPKIDADASGAISAAQAAERALNGIKDEDVYINYHSRGRPGGTGNNIATGGYVTGPGSGTSDSIPARLSNGEYVIKAAAVSRYGVDMFHRLNAMRFADGGPVGQQTSTASVGVSFPSKLALVVNGEAFDAYVVDMADSRINAYRHHDRRMAGR